MAKFFELLRAVLSEVLDGRIDKAKVDKIAADVAAIRVFFGIPEAGDEIDQATIDEMTKATAGLSERLRSSDAVLQGAVDSEQK